MGATCPLSYGVAYENTSFLATALAAYGYVCCDGLQVCKSNQQKSTYFMTNTETAPNLPENPVLIKISSGFAKWDEAKQAIQLVEDPQQSTVFPQDVAQKVVEALKANGVEEQIELVPVSLNAEEGQN